MLRKLLILLFILCGTVCGTFSYAQIFSPMEKQNRSDDSTWMSPSKFELFQLNVPLLESKLKKSFKLTFPLPGGKHVEFQCIENNLLPGSLREKYNLRAWDLRNAEGSGKLDWTTLGLRASFNFQGSRYYLEPRYFGEKKIVQLFEAKHSPQKDEFKCQTYHADHEGQVSDSHKADGTIGTIKRVFDIAIAVTGEYTNFYGGTVAGALSGITTTLNRANEIYERDLATSFRLVSNNDLIVYTDPDNDPFTNGNLSQMLSENQDVINNVIGSSNYDVGHVFGTLGGGLARVNSICNSFTKARAATALSFPQGDVFNVDYFCHELGHQFGATHTFNNCSGSWGGIAAFEPGSGSSIMSYAGICGSDNVQMVSDRYFHFGSQEQMVNTGTACALIQNPNNNPPNVLVTSPDGLVLPIGTPFILNGSGSDVESSILDYSWDQMDVSTLVPYGAPNREGPLFRHYEADTGFRERYFPSLENLILGGDPSEVLPIESRTVNFVYSVRDNHPGGGATSYTDYSLDFTANAGPFKIIYPNVSGLKFEEGDNLEIQWDVAGTDQIPVSCSQVSILLSTDGGFTYPFVLASSTPNDGLEVVQLPTEQSPACRIMVKALGNVFFNISENNFEIGENLVPEIDLIFEDTSFYTCTDDAFTINFDLKGRNGYRSPTTFQVENAPPFVDMLFDPQGPVTPDRNIRLNIGNLNDLISGSYTFEILAQSIDGLYTKRQIVILNIQDQIPPELAFESPDNFTEITENSIPFTWPLRANTSHYRLQVSNQSDFSSLVLDTLIPSDQTSLNWSVIPFSIYYCRIRTENACNVSNYSLPILIRTSSFFCNEYLAEVNFVIPSGSAQTYAFDTLVNEDFELQEIKMNDIKGRHDNTAVLEYRLIYPDGSRKSMISFPCPGEEDYHFSVSSTSGAPVSCPLDRRFEYRSESDLNRDLPLSSAGRWGLELVNNDRTTGGELHTFELQLCGRAVNRSSDIYVERNLEISVLRGRSALITEDKLLYDALNTVSRNIMIIPESLPSHGVLSIAGEEVDMNTWIPQERILEHQLVYKHDGGSDDMDAFRFSVVASEIGVLTGQQFNIRIEENSLDAQAVILQALECPNQNNASIKIEATGGIPPYIYGIQDFAFQTDSIFSGLSAGKYIFTVEDQTGAKIALQQVEIQDVPDYELTYDQVARTVILHLKGGTAPYQFSLNGSLFTTDSVFTNLFNGSQRLTVQDAKSCRETLFFWFEFIPVALELNNISLPLCHDSKDASISIGGSHGLPPYRYALNNGPFVTDSVFANLPAGIYNLKVIDALGELDELNGVEIIEPDPITATTNVIDQDIFIDAQGGTGQFLYRLDGGELKVNSVFRDVSLGMHTVEVVDQNGCSIELQVNVIENPISMDFEIYLENLCFGDSLAAVRIEADGGAEPYQYRLNGGLFQEDNNFENLPAGNYSAEVMDADGRTQILNGIRINEPSELNVNVIVQTDTVLVMVTGGIPPYEYNLDDQGFTIDSTFHDVSSGLHVVKVLDQNNCVKEYAFTVDVSALNLSLNIIQHPSCFDREDGVIMVNASGGVSPYEYSLDNMNFQQSDVFTGLSGRRYVVYVRDDQGTIGLSNVVELDAPPPLVASISVREDSVFIDPFGGTGQILTSLDGSPFDSLYLYTGLSGGMHEIVIQDENLCESSYNITIVYNVEVDREGLKIYPNPTHGFLHINSISPIQNIELLNYQGRLLKKFNESFLDLTDYPNGLYFVKIFTQRGWVMKKLILSR